MRVGLDCSNGSASSVAKSVFDAIGAKTYVIHNEPDGTNINCGCGSTHIEGLQKFVVEKGLDRNTSMSDLPTTETQTAASLSMSWEMW